MDFAERVALFLDIKVDKHTERYFDDGESYVKSDENVRGQDVYVISSLYSDEKQQIGEKFTNLLMFITSLVDASADRVTVVAPYLGYSRQDRKTESRAPVTTKSVAKLLEVAGADRVLTIDVHNLSAFHNAFRIPVDNLEARKLFLDYLVGNSGLSPKISDPLPPAEALAIMSPDAGGTQRAIHFRDGLAARLKVPNDTIEVAILAKHRTEKGVTGSKIIGNVEKKQVIVVDDMIASGSTIDLCLKAIQAHKGETYAVAATHGLFIGKANEYLAGVKRLLVTDTIPSFRLDKEAFKGRLHVIPTALMFARAIRRTHEEGGSISDLLSERGK
jgi:ribose-phosphate pyrophosphokinase